jgi:DNA-binding Lrp family transcriptional regulator
MVTAIILIKADRGGVERASQGLLKAKGITEVYSVAGEFDIVAIARVRQNDDLAKLVTEDMLNIEGIARTETLIAFRQYSNFDLAAMFDLE